MRISPNRLITTVFGAVYLLVGLLGLFLLSSPLNIIALNGADNVLHLASAVLLLGVGLVPGQVPRRAGLAGHGFPARCRIGRRGCPGSSPASLGSGQVQ